MEVVAATVRPDCVYSVGRKPQRLAKDPTSALEVPYKPLEKEDSMTLIAALIAKRELSALMEALTIDHG